MLLTHLLSGYCFVYANYSPTPCLLLYLSYLLTYSVYYFINATYSPNLCLIYYFIYATYSPSLCLLLYLCYLLTYSLFTTLSMLLTHLTLCLLLYLCYLLTYSLFTTLSMLLTHLLSVYYFIYATYSPYSRSNKDKADFIRGCSIQSILRGITFFFFFFFLSRPLYYRYGPNLFF